MVVHKEGESCFFFLICEPELALNSSEVQSSDCWLLLDIVSSFLMKVGATTGRLAAPSSGAVNDALLGPAQKSRWTLITLSFNLADLKTLYLLL